MSAVGHRRAVLAQTRMELLLASRQGEQLLVSLGIPLGALLFFSQVDVLPSGDLSSIDFLAPGILAIAIMGSAMVSLGIGAGFDRHYGVLKRLAVTPLGRGPWITAKTLTVALTAGLQVAILSAAGLAVGWDPQLGALPATLVGLVLGTVAFSGLGLLLAGTLPGLTNLAANNALYLVLVGLGGLAFPLAELPGPAAEGARFLPSAALGTLLRDALALGTTNREALMILLVWAVLLPLTTMRLFRWT